MSHNEISSPGSDRWAAAAGGIRPHCQTGPARKHIGREVRGTAVAQVHQDDHGRSCCSGRTGGSEVKQGHALGSSVPVPEKIFMKSTIGTQFCSLHLIDETNSGGWLLGLVAEVSSKYDLLP